LAFSRIVETHSLSWAEAELGAPRATISRRMARLEERIGERLLRRTTRTLVLTDAGEALRRHARIVLDALAQAEGCVRQNDHAVRGELRVSAPLIASSTGARRTEVGSHSPRHNNTAVCLVSRAASYRDSLAAETRTQDRRRRRLHLHGERVLSGEVGAEARLSVVYLESEFVPPQLRRFIDAVVAWSNAEGAHAPPAKRSEPPKIRHRSRNRNLRAGENPAVER
jgi:DNA-binding transcriptional LysR family regulator